MINRKRGEKITPARVPTCHPDKPYCGDGLCATCYYHKNHDRRLEAHRAWKRANKEHAKAYHRQWVYGITQEEYDARFAQQNGCCAICNEPLLAVHIDHNHACCSGERSCGKCVRGLLCEDCNRGLGSFHDDPINLLNAIRYLFGGDV
jgi:hypothetical protein